VQSPVLCVSVDETTALVILRFRHLGHHFLGPGDFADVSIKKVLYLVQSAGLRYAQAKGCSKERKQSRCKGHCRAHPEVLYHNGTNL